MDAREALELPVSADTLPPRSDGHIICYLLNADRFTHHDTKIQNEKPQIDSGSFLNKKFF